MRVTQDAIEESNNEELEKAVEKAREEGRKTVRTEDF